jgi:hypothetical protein
MLCWLNDVLTLLFRYLFRLCECREGTLWFYDIQAGWQSNRYKLLVVSLYGIVLLSISVSLCMERVDVHLAELLETHTHTHVYIYIYIFIYGSFTKICIYIPILVLKWVKIKREKLKESMYINNINILAIC